MADHARAERPPAASALAAILDEAVALQPEMEALMGACLGAPASAALARRVRPVRLKLADLAWRIDGLPASDLAEEARVLLEYHHRLLFETISLAFNVRSPTSFRRAVGLFSGELGEPGARLRGLRGRVASLAAQDEGEGDEGEGEGAMRLEGARWSRESASRLLQGIVEASARLAHTIDDLGYLASIRAGARSELEWCDPAELLEAAVSGRQPAARASERIQRVVLAESWTPHGLVLADRALVQCAVANILDNAIRRGTASSRLSLAARVGEQRLTVLVSDEASALPGGTGHDGRELVWNDVLLGIGSGIATTVGLVRARGGTVSFSATAEGTCYRIRLPDRPTGSP